MRCFTAGDFTVISISPGLECLGGAF
jgi:hypothetical protein